MPAAGQCLGPDREEVAGQLLPVGRQDPDVVGIITSDAALGEKADSKIVRRRAGERAAPAKSIGETIELQPSAGSAGAVANERRRFTRKARPRRRLRIIRGFFGEEFDAVIDRRDRRAQFVAQERREQLQHPHVDSAADRSMSGAR
jgi:hypothetical protein